MIIRSLARYPSDVELRWLYGPVRQGDQIKIRAQFLNHDTGATFFENLPFGMMPFLMPGLVVSQGVVRTERRTGKRAKAMLADLSAAEDIGVMDGIARAHYDLAGHRGGSQRILRYRAGSRTILIPATELIRFLFMHSKVLAHAVLTPSGLMDLAVTPMPGLYPEVEIGFTDAVPRKLMTPEFVKEFAWLAIHPEGRKAWDSVRERSGGQRFLTLSPPRISRCQLVCRGIEWNSRLLVLEIQSLTGRQLPAGEIKWTHPSEYVRTPGGTVARDPHGDGSTAVGRPRHEREHVVDGEADSRRSVNQDVALLGGKRGCFNNWAAVIRVPRRRPSVAIAEGGDLDPSLGTRKQRSDAGQVIDPIHLPTVVRQFVSAGEPVLTGTAPPIDFTVLENASRDHIGDLELLESVLLRIEAADPDLTLSRHLVHLKQGKAISTCGPRRRACLVAVFTSSTRPPRVILDVDHTELNGLAGLLLRYEAATPLERVAEHVRGLLAAMVDNHGHWDSMAETRLRSSVGVKRLPKLLRMTHRVGDEGYGGGWAQRLLQEILYGGS